MSLMLQSVTDSAPVELTPVQSKAVVFVAEDILTDEEIAKKVNVSRMTLARWKILPEFGAAVAATRTAFYARAMEEGIGRVDIRVANLNDRWRRLKRVMSDRAEEMAGVCPGGETGTMIREVMFVKVFELPKSVQKKLDDGSITEDDLKQEDFIQTRQTRAVEKFSVDTGLLAEMRALEQQAAKELGQWVDKTDSRFTGSISAVSQYDVSTLSTAELEQMESMLTKAHGGK